MSGWSRRQFLKRSSAAAALGMLSQVPGRELWGMRPTALFMLPLEDDLLRSLAAVAVDTARAAGADFADVRIGIGRTVRVRTSYWAGRNGNGPLMQSPEVREMVGYGVRVLVDGSWGLAAGFELNSDAVARITRAAMVRARAAGPIEPRPLAPVQPLLDARYETSIEEDPFERSIGEQGDVQLAALAAVAERAGVQQADADFHWQDALHVFASTDGSLGVQRLRTALPRIAVAASAADAYTAAGESVPVLSGRYGWEAVSRFNLPAGVRDAADRAVEASRALTPPLAVDVGRYDLVVSAGDMGRLVFATLAQALNAERALGFRANRGGTSFIAPPEDVLGSMRVGSPLLNLHADRTRAHGHSTVGWDDEGVRTEAFPLILDGVVTDYLTSRETAAELGPWYARRSEEVRSHGCVCGAGQSIPEVHVPNLTLMAGPDEVDDEDLIAATDRGFYLEGFASGGPDQQLLSSQFGIANGRAWEIRNGRRTGRIRDMAIQFITPDFWRSMDAVGGTGSEVDGMQGVNPGRHPLQQWFATVTAVPARFRDVNVLNVGSAP